MADSATTMDLARRRQWKLWTLPVGAAIVAVILTAAIGYHPVAALLNIPQTFLAAVGATQERIHDAPGWLSTSLDWAAGPIVWLLLGLALVKFPPVGALIDAVFPDPPAFVFRDLTERRRLDMVLIDRAPPDFTGRDEELAELIELLDPDDGSHAFAWRTVLGPTGIGKSRLAIEWLAAAQAKGWDVGIVDPKDRPLLAGWRPRRPTALVIDEARSRWSDDLAEALLALGARASARRPVRLLVLDQIAPFVQHRELEAQVRLDAAEIAPAMAVAPLDDAAIAAIVGEGPARAGDAARIVAESAGRPRAAIVLAHFADATSYADALRRWAELLIPELRDDSATPPVALAVPLICAALAGPIDADAVRPYAPGYDAGALLRFFDRETRASLERELPALVPDDLAQEIALRLLLKLDTPNRAALIDHLVTLAPARMEASLGAIWRDRPELDGAGADDATAAVLRAVQAAFDAAWPERVATLIADASSLVDTISVSAPRSNVRSAMVTLDVLLRSRPFDVTIRHLEVCCCSNVVNHFGATEDWMELEKWGDRLKDITKLDHVRSGEGTYCEAVRAAANATFYYSRGGELSALLRWYDWAESIAVLDNTKSVDAQLMFLLVMVNVTSALRRARRWAELGRIAEAALPIVTDPAFEHVAAIRNLDAQISTNAIINERPYASCLPWIARIEALLDDRRFARDQEVNLNALKGVTNAIGVQGKEGRWDLLDDYADRLSSIARKPRFSHNPLFREQEVFGIVTIIFHYGNSEFWDHAQYWGNRSLDVFDDPRFAGEPAIRLQEAKIATNLILYLGRAGLLHEVRFWSRRLAVLADDRRFHSLVDVRLQEVMGAVNLLIAGDRSIELTTQEIAHWKQRIAMAAQAFPSHLRIQQHARNFGLNFLAQTHRDFAVPRN